MKKELLPQRKIEKFLSTGAEKEEIGIYQEMGKV